MSNPHEQEILARLNHEQPPTPQDFAYYYTIVPHPESAWLTEQVLQPAVLKAHHQYGINVQPLAWGELPAVDHRIPYVSVIGINPLALEQDGAHLEKLASLVATARARINLAPFFPYQQPADIATYQALAAQIIPALDKRLGINTIFADEVEPEAGIKTISTADLLSNFICETIRVKYHGTRESNPHTQTSLEFAHKEFGPTIQRLQQLFAQYRLYHRAPTDGAIVIKTKNGWLSSQTKTNKTTMTAENFSWISTYAAEKNSLTYEGSKLPSSDAPEILEMLRHLNITQTGTVVIHFHQNDLTRGHRFPEHVTQQVIEYGLFESGWEMAQEMQRIGDHWLILKEHGLVWIGDSLDEFEHWLGEVGLG